MPLDGFKSTEFGHRLNIPLALSVNQSGSDSVVDLAQYTALG